MPAPTPEELAERIVWGVENRFVSETTGFLIDRLTSIDYRAADVEYWVRRMANENGHLLLDIYAKYKDAITDDARAILEPALEDVETERALQQATGNTDPSLPYTASRQRITDATVKNCAAIIDRQNIAMASQQEQLWYEVATTAITRINGEMMAVDDAIADAVKELSARQIRTIDYKSGVSTNIDVAVRRHIVTQTNQAYQRMTEARAVEYDWDLFMCSSHGASRPEHYRFQGHVFSKGRYIGQRIDGHTVQDYGDLGVDTVTGIYGANCRHYLTPYVPGLSEVQEPPYGERENEKVYDLTQKQRYYERQIRYTKAEVHDLRRAGADDTDARLRLGAQQRRLAAFCGDNGLPRRYDLEKAYGIGDQPRGLRSALRENITSKTPSKPTPKYVYQEATTKAQAKQNLIDLGFTDISSALTVDELNNLCKAFSGFYSEYPFMVGTVRTIKTGKTGAVAYYDAHEVKTALGQKMFSPLFKIDRADMATAATDAAFCCDPANFSSGYRWWSVKAGLDGIVKHEGTHAIEYKLLMRRMGFAEEEAISPLDAFKFWRRRGEVSEEIVKEAFSRCGIAYTRENVCSHISEYAWKSTLETLAEAVSCEDNTNQVCNTIKDVLHEVLVREGLM